MPRRRARGIESEAQIPFASLLELIRPALALLENIPEPQAVALEGALALRPGPAQERFAVGAATLSLLAAYAEQGPVVVLLDDAHWLDDSSAQALLFAFRRLVVDPIAVLIAVREGEQIVARRSRPADATDRRPHGERGRIVGAGAGARRCAISSIGQQTATRWRCSNWRRTQTNSRLRP